MKSFQ